MLTGGGFNISSFGIRIISLWKRRSRKCVKNIFGKVESRTVSSMNLAACGCESGLSLQKVNVFSGNEEGSSTSVKEKR